MLTAFDRDNRKALLERARLAIERHERVMSYAAAQLPWSDAQAAALAQAPPAFDAVRQAEGEYLGRAPRVAMGCCPYDGRPLIRSIDPFGFDGPWWRRGSVVEELPPCPHFCVLRGAVNFAGATYREPGYPVEPSMPHVVPRLLQFPTMIAVLAQLDFPDLPTIWTIAYFAQRRPQAETLAADWPRSQFVYTSQTGARGWHPDDEAVDGNLMPWLRMGKLRWCEPGSENTKLSELSVGSCPYLGA